MEIWVFVAGLLVFIGLLATALAVGKWQWVVVGGVVLCLSVIPVILAGVSQDAACREAGGVPSRNACLDPGSLIQPSPSR